MVTTHIKAAKQGGFTLIELIAVIVILGILAATALPRFANLSGDARAASLRAAKGALGSTAAMAHTKALVSNNMSATIMLEGQPVSLHHGYPAAGNLAQVQMFAAAAGLGTSIGLHDDYNISFENGGLTVSPKDVSPANRATCALTYVQAASAEMAPTWIEHASNGKFICD